MLKTLLVGAATAATLAFAGGASAATYVSTLAHDDNNASVDGDFGTVTIVEEDANNILVTVMLNAPLTLIVDTGKHNAFTFNLIDNPNSTVSVVEPVGGGSFTYAGEGVHSNPPFGNNAWTNAIECCGRGSSNGEPPPLVFRVTNLSGITFAGVGATFDADGRLTAVGTGNRFASTSAGWWFAVDTSDGSNTGAVAARDAFLVPTTTGAIPEPGTWALMILGFGGAGAMLRRRRTLTAFA